MTPNCRQTSCRYCETDIEGFSPYRRGEWHDRGGNSTCIDGRQHAPYRGRDERVNCRCGSPFDKNGECNVCGRKRFKDNRPTITKGPNHADH